jgi:glycosyltransferase involved in cell wall biosynthesis
MEFGFGNSYEMKISTLTPSYNSAKFLERAIKSVISQDYKNWEHIIMDAASQDGTIDILKKYSHLIWESKKDKGQSDAMNKAFAKATGDIIIYLNADDELEPGWFSKLVKIFQEREDL